MDKGQQQQQQKQGGEGGNGHGGFRILTRAQMFKVLDRYGPYQRRMMILIVLPLIMSGFMSMVTIATFFAPDHRCRVPGLNNDTYAIQNEAHRALVNLSIPMTSSDGDVTYDKCDVYRDRDDVARANRTLYDDKEACDSWVYDVTDFDNTITTQFDLVCADKGFRANFNMIYMLGLLAGSAVSGILCDRFGRKRMFMIGLILTTIFSAVIAFPVIPEMLMVYRFLAIFFGAFLYLGLYVLCIEMVGPEQRTLAGSLMQIYWCFGPILAALLAYVIRDWRWIHLSMSPFILLICYQWILDESPRWLKTRGREREATAVILKVMKANKMTSDDLDRDLDDDAIKMDDLKQKNGGAHPTNKDMESSDKGGMTQKKNKEGVADGEREIPDESIFKLFKYPNLIGRTGIIFFNWSAVSTTYYGLSLNVANLAGSFKLNFLLAFLVELPAYFIAWFLLDRLGRQRSHCLFMFLAGLCCVATIFSVMYGGTDLEWVTVLLVMVGKLAISAAFSTVYLMSGELFPTVLRNRGIGASSTIARVASAISPYIADLSLHIEGPMGEALPLVIFGALALAAGLLALCLPETLHRKLPDTIEEAANFAKSKPVDPPAPVNVQHISVRL